jgi:hypothetical protein
MGGVDAGALDATPTDPRPLCSAETTRRCCGVIGPLAPPNLAAHHRPLMPEPSD